MEEVCAPSGPFPPPLPWGLKGQGGGTPLQTTWTGQGERGSPDEPLGQSLLPPHLVLDGLPDRASSLCPSLAVDPTRITHSCLPHLWHQEFLFTLWRGERGYGKAASDLVTSHSKTTGSINLPRSSGCETGFADGCRSGPASLSGPHNEGNRVLVTLGRWPAEMGPWCTVRSYGRHGKLPVPTVGNSRRERE